MAVEAKIVTLIDRLFCIAKKNKDVFNYRIEMELIRNSPFIRYHFICEESSEGHVFVSGVGDTIEEAVDDAEQSIGDCLKLWKYKDAKSNGLRWS